MSTTEPKQGTLEELTSLLEKIDNDNAKATKTEKYQDDKPQELARSAESDAGRAGSPVRHTEPSFRRGVELEEPLSELYCHECNVAIGLFYSAKRRVLRRRSSLSNNGGSSQLLTSKEMEEVKGMIAGHLEHLETCPATKL